MDVDKILKTIGGIVVLALVIVIAVYIVHGLIWLFCTVLYYMLTQPLYVLIGGVAGMVALYVFFRWRDGYFFRNK
jgi:hypothetical protein